MIFTRVALKTTRAPVVSNMSRQLSYMHPEQRLAMKRAQINSAAVNNGNISPLFNKQVPFNKDHPDYRYKMAQTMIASGQAPSVAGAAAMTPENIQLLSKHYLPHLKANDGTSSGAVVANRLRMGTEKAMEKILTEAALKAKLPPV
jgi:hypothetical protein